MSKISGWNFLKTLHQPTIVNKKMKIMTYSWYVGMNDFARIAGGQNSRSKNPFRAFLEFLAKIFTLGYVDFSKRSNEAGRNMMAHIKSILYQK